ncbi:ATP synthase subunit I [Thioalkalivibrio sp. HK1]|uniref:ATP synthase subunit I n=1 Tax=Thioalkalivibrio sp. HK1 TaxID=1469245 RepID=UPI0004B3C1D4|nr:ATP synthase subunit I [Thioalkalivibrio sp. HK1]
MSDHRASGSGDVMKSSSLGLRVVQVQGLLLVTVGLGAYLWGPQGALFSALVGAFNSLVPSVYFAHKVLRSEGGSANALGQWLRAEVGKIAIICGLFLATFLLLKDLNVPALFAGFITVHIGGVIASIVFSSTSRIR